MGIVGIQSNVANRFFGINNTKSVTLSVETHMLTIQNGTTFNGQPNTMNLQLQRYYSSSISATTNRPVILNIYKNATVTGTSFSSVNSNSITQYSTAGTYSSGTGILLVIQFLWTRAFNPTYIDLVNNNFTVYPGETLTVTIIDYSGNDTIIAGLNWAELF
jgi:hypothetical protein